VANYWDRFVEGVGALGTRLFEETGGRDVWDELARFDDEEMSVGRFFSVAGGALWQAKDIPLQSLATPGIEANRVLGSGVDSIVRQRRNWMEGRRSGETAIEGIFGRGMPAAEESLFNYATGGTTAEEREVAPGLYKAGSLSDHLVIAADRLVQAGFPKPLLAGGGVFGLGGIPWLIGDAKNRMDGKAGALANGGYVPDAFDITVPDLGEQLSNSDLRTAAIVSNFATEALVDPLNFIIPAGVVGRVATVGRKGNRIVATAGAANLASAADVAELTGGIQRARTLRRFFQSRPGIGLWNRDNLIQAMTRSEGGSSLVHWFAENNDVRAAYKKIVDLNMASGDGASALAKLSTYMRTDREVVAMFDAAAYRNVRSVELVRAAVSESTPLSNEIDTLLRTQDSIFTKAVTDFPEGGVFPDGHIIKTSADEFLEQAFQRQPTLRARWEALDSGIREQAVADFAKNARARKTGIETVETMFAPDRVDQVLERFPSLGFRGKAGRKLNAALVEPEAPKWLSDFTPVISVTGGANRFQPRFLLLAKPGLVFQLHGTDAIERFDDMIKYANDLIPSKRLPNYRFADDARVIAMRERFLEAGAVTSNPEQIRAGIVDELQEMVLGKLAEGAGFEPEVATLIAGAGMDKSRAMMAGLLSKDKGYLTAIKENGVPYVLKNRPTTVRQTANHVPIMDWAGLRKAMHSPVMRRQAFMNPDGLVSVSDVQGIVRDYEGAFDSFRGLRKFGRTEKLLPSIGGGAGKAVHTLVDWMDTANNFFKASVLLRLGYPVRNIGEGMLSIGASSAGWVDVMSNAHLGAILRNTWLNYINPVAVARRNKDRFKSWRGIQKDLPVLERMARVSEGSVAMSGDYLADLFRQIDSDNLARHLGRIIRDSDDAVEVERAREALRFIGSMRENLALGLERNMVERGWDLPDDIRGAQRLYHADPQGRLGVQQSPWSDAAWDLDHNKPLRRPISTTPHEPVARAHVDNAWDYTFKQGDTPGWATRPVREFSEEPTTFWTADGRSGVVGPKPTSADAQTVGNPMALNEIVARSKSSQPMIWVWDDEAGDFVRRKAARIETPGETFDLVDLDEVGGTAAELRLGKVQANEAQYLLETFADADIPGAGRWRIDNGRLIIPDEEARQAVLFSINSRLEIIADNVADGEFLEFTRAQYAAQRRALESLRARVEAVEITAPEKVRRPRFDESTLTPLANSGRAQFSEFSEKLAEMNKTHLVMFREAADAPWKQWFVAGQGRNYVKGVSENWEFRTIPREIADDVTRPRVVGIDTWGREYDFRTPEGMEIALREHPRLDPDVLEAAVGGDRKMQERVSNALAKDGVYRTAWLDSDQWSGVNVLVHPEGIGSKGFDRAVKSYVDRWVKEAADESPMDVAKAANVTQTGRKLEHAEVANLNRGNALSRLGKAVAPDYAKNAAHVLMSGGVEEVVADAMRQHLDLVRRNNAIKAAVMKRRNEVSSLAKVRGIPADVVRFNSDYGDGVLMDDMLGGFDGDAYGQFASADMTNAYTFGASTHNADLMHGIRSSMLEPRLINADDPYYFDGFANLLGRYLRDQPGAQDFLKMTGKVSVDDIDPIIRFALSSGDRQNLYNRAVHWVLNTPEGQDWMKSMDLVVTESGLLPDSVKSARIAARNRTGDLGGSGYKPAQKRVISDDRVRSFYSGGPGVIPMTDIDVADMIAEQFNFVDNFFMGNPRLRDLFLRGEATADNIRALYQQEPWDLLPFHGALSPTSAEYRDLMGMRARQRFQKRKVSEVLLDSFGYALRKIGSEPETRMLRHPLFNAIGKADLQQRIKFAETVHGRALSLTELNRLRSRSQQFALKKMRETLYTLERRSTLDDYMRFVSPFFPAWSNVLSRWSRFYVNDPSHVARMYRTMTSLTRDKQNRSEASSLIVDENGYPVDEDTDPYDSYLILPFGTGDIPGVSHILSWAKGVDREMMQRVMSRTFIPLRSIDVVGQGEWLNPGFGPIIAMPAQAILTHRDDWAQQGLGKEIVDLVMPVGPANTGNVALDTLQQVLPSAGRALLNRYLKDNKAFLGAYNRTYLTLVAMREAGEYDGDGDQLAHDAMKLTEILQGMKVVSAVAAPVANQQKGDFEYYSAYWREMRDNYEAQGFEDPDELADQEFLRRFPAQFVLSQGSTMNLTGSSSNAYVTGNQKRYNSIERAAARLGDPRLLAFSDMLLPDNRGIYQPTTEDYNAFSRRWQTLYGPEGFSDPYRSPKKPEEVARQSQVEAGWTLYSKYEAAVDAQLVAAGLAPNTYEFNKTKGKVMPTIADAIKAQNPIWALERGSFNSSRNETNAIFFRYLINNDEWLADNKGQEVVPLIADYLDTRDRVRMLMAARGEAKQTNALANEDANAILLFKRQQLSTQSATFRWWVDRYFRNDIVSTDDVMEAIP